MMVNAFELSIFHLVQVIAGYLLLLFIPGYAISWALYPAADQLRLSVRVAYSCILSITTVIGTVLVIDLLFGMNTTPLNIVLPLLAITLIAGLIWVIQSLYGQSRLKKRLSTLISAPGTRKALSWFRGISLFISRRIPQDVEENAGVGTPGEKGGPGDRRAVVTTINSATTIAGETPGPSSSPGSGNSKDSPHSKEGPASGSGDIIRDEDLFE